MDSCGSIIFLLFYFYFRKNKKKRKKKKQLVSYRGVVVPWIKTSGAPPLILLFHSRSHPALNCCIRCSQLESTTIFTQGAMMFSYYTHFGFSISQTVHLN